MMGESILSKMPIATSRQLINELTKKAGLSEAAARKRLGRLSTNCEIWRSSALSLPRNERLFALKISVGTRKFGDACAKALDRTRPGIARTLRAITRRQVIIDPILMRLLACPLEGPVARKYPGLERDLLALEELEITTHDTMLGIGYLRARPLSDVAVLKRILNEQRTSLLTSIAITRILLSHLKKIGLLSWNGNNYGDVAHGGNVTFNGFAFSASGYSYARPLVRYKPGKAGVPTPVLIDVFAEQATVDDVASFVDRIARARPGKESAHNTLPIVAAPHFSTEAWKLAKNEKLLTVNLQQAFGPRALEAMKQIAELMDSKDLLKDAEKIDHVSHLLDELAGNPVITEIISVSFEAVSALALRSGGWESVSTNIRVPYQKDLAREIDVSGTQRGGEDVKIIECKAYNSKKSISRSEVEKFYTETVPAFLRTLQRPCKRCFAEIWTSGLVDQDAKDKLKELILKPKIVPRLLCGDEVQREIPDSIASCRRLVATIAKRASIEKTP